MEERKRKGKRVCLSPVATVYRSGGAKRGQDVESVQVTVNGPRHNYYLNNQSTQLSIYLLKFC